MEAVCALLYRFAVIYLLVQSMFVVMWWSTSDAEIGFWGRIAGLAVMYHDRSIRYWA